MGKLRQMATLGDIRWRHQMLHDNYVLIKRVLQQLHRSRKRIITLPLYADQIFRLANVSQEENTLIHYTTYQRKGGWRCHYPFGYFLPVAQRKGATFFTTFSVNKAYDPKKERRKDTDDRGRKRAPEAGTYSRPEPSTAPPAKR